MQESKRSIMALVKRKGFRKLLTLCRKYMHLYIIVILLQLGGTASALLLAETSRRLFDGGAALSKEELTGLIVWLILFVFVGLVLSLLSRVFNQIVNTNVVFRMRQMLLSQLTGFSLSYHENKHSSHAKNLLFNELEVFKQFVVFDVLRLISLPFSFIAVGVYLMTVQPLLGIIAICIGPLQLISNLVVKESFKNLVAQQQAWGGEVFFHIGETLSGMREVKMNQLEDSVSQRFQHVVQKGIRLWVSIEKMNAYRELIRILPEKLGYLLGMTIGGVMMVSGQIGPGALVAFITLLDKAAAPFASMVGIIDSLQKVSAGAEKLLDVMELETENGGRGRELQREPFTIEFDNVTFGYEPGHPVLKNVCFTIQPGSSVALVGPSGGGKSTLVKLLYRFYTPQKGQIRINGIPINGYSIESLRRSLSAVTQDVYLFDGTIRDNIMIGAPDAGQQDIERATLLSHSAVFIEKLPEGLETKVGERGIKLSQGQKQRIAIARAILRNAPLVILDEPTSALDVETESMFQHSLGEWAEGCTKVIIAHRLSTIRDADVIVFLENGEVREMGSPKQLLASGGRFADFWQKQEIREFVS